MIAEKDELCQQGKLSRMYVYSITTFTVDGSSVLQPGSPHDLCCSSVRYKTFHSSVLGLDTQSSYPTGQLAIVDSSQTYDQCEID